MVNLSILRNWPQVWSAGAVILILSNVIALLHLWLSLGWLAELLVSFLSHLSSLALFWLVLGLPYWERRRMALLLVMLLVTIALELVMVFSGTEGQTSKEIPNGGQALQVATVNILSPSQGYPALADWIRSEKVELLGLVEFNERWGRELDSKIGADLPYRYDVPRADNYGLALWSKWPLANCQTREDPGLEMIPAIVCELNFQGRQVSVWVLHPCPPVAPARLKLRDRYFDAVYQKIVTWKNPVLVLGDFNTVPWAPKLREFTRGLELQLVGTALGAQTTWPGFLPAFLRIPIDHILFSQEFTAGPGTVSPSFGSDHRGLVATLWLAL